MRSSLASWAAGLLFFGASLPCGSVHAMPATSGAQSGPSVDPSQDLARGSAALNAGYYREAADSFTRVTELRPNDAEAWHMLGLAKFAAGDVRGAEHAYARSVALDPGPVAPHRDFAIALAKLKQKDKAAAQLDVLKAKAAACNDACPQAPFLRAAIAAVEVALSG